ncbi:hypothetical protein [Phenylobacterium sp.]|uniref:hypothetical protein n=1 Tax=Phenylobacterium sp. TaxID=1871053 RepID=UPI003918ED61
MADLPPMTGWPQVADVVRELWGRVERLEKHSHPPIDLGPAMDEILDARGYRPTAVEITSADPVLAVGAALAALTAIADLVEEYEATALRPPMDLAVRVGSHAADAIGALRAISTAQSLPGGARHG